MIDINKLDQLQLEAAGLVTGLPIFTSSGVINKELGLETLAERRERRKNQMFYNVTQNNVPEYLSNLIPPTSQSMTVYELYATPFCRLALTNASIYTINYKSME